MRSFFLAGKAGGKKNFFSNRDRYVDSLRWHANVFSGNGGNIFFAFPFLMQAKVEDRTKVGSQYRKFFIMSHECLHVQGCILVHFSRVVFFWEFYFLFVCMHGMLGQKLFDLHTTRSYALFLLSTLSFTQEFTLFPSLLSFYLLFLFLSPLLLYIFIHCPSPSEETVKKFHVVITANSTHRRDIESGNMEAFVSLRPRAV